VESADLKKWARDLARNTQDVVAVANRMVLIAQSLHGELDAVSTKAEAGLYSDAAV
jgi:hypothetical protein